MRLAALALGTVALSLGCAATAPRPPQAAGRPAKPLTNGPSMQETGRFGVVPPSSFGTKIEDGPIDKQTSPPLARSAP